ncbi:MAG: DUF664 domain-containing protein [Candidatus Latescibacteria bacterium]|nr:DUF664 domain-containing protein [Candidatus Latescibacterota bacterium]NIO27112.1 DUF664 domain-containing protein [Candidatus Latescibacterota bacterium]NIO54636.1 DUF664 domain-containing protein [Candidatus Latescibacterota bacterium]NIT00719.1 DUF664 domain-containing protein [Candidatus Latescibacterota bacterium]NIT37642.1 DUF664 domain-containing protein [Candidatus Latescibacterota bacterium]
MPNKFIGHRPEKKEYFEFYDRYVKLVPEGDIVAILREQLQTTLELLRGVPQEKVDHRYAPGKWTLKEVVGHVIDMEWVFSYRALSFARCKTPPLPGVDQEEFMSGANFSARAMSDLMQELQHLRSANILLFDSFDETILDRTGIASDCRFTVRSIAYIIAGHEKHHMEVLSEKYLSGGV